MIEKDLIPVIKSLRLVVFDFDGVFTTNQVLVNESGVEAVLCNRSDGLGMRLLAAEKIEAMILSTEVNPVVQARARKLKLECVAGSAKKGTALREIAARKGLTLEQVAYVGNDANDLECLGMVGLAVAVGDSFPEAKS